MSESSGFFISHGGDRRYTPDWLAGYIKALVTTGVYRDELGVAAADGMAVTVAAGRAWIEGYLYRLDIPLTLSIANADAARGRIDVVALRLDLTARTITAQVVQGTPGQSPAAPSPTRTEDVYDLVLAEISVPAGASSITQTQIRDTRLDDAVCGITVSAVQHIPTASFLAQMESSFAAFMQEWGETYTKFLGDNQSTFESFKEEHFTAFEEFMQERFSSFDNWFAELKKLFTDEKGEMAQKASGIYYGTSLTMATEQTKIVDCPDFSLREGAMIIVKFSSHNSADDPRLNVNGTGAKYIHYAGDTLTDENAAPASALKPDWLYLFRYNGAVYEIVGELPEVDTALEAKVSVVRFPAISVPASAWGMIDPPYARATIRVPGMLSTDDPIVVELVHTDNDMADVPMENAFSLINRIETKDDRIVLRATEIPEVDISLRMVVIR